MSGRLRFTDCGERYRLLADHISDVVWVLDIDSFTYDYVSPSIEAVFGYSVQEAMSLQPTEHMTPESLETALAELENTLAADDMEDGSRRDRPRLVGLEQLHKDGRIIYTETRISLLRDEAGTPYAYLGISRDVSQRHRAEDKLRESEQRYRLLAENSTDVIVRLSENSEIQYVSPSSSNLLGYTPEEVLASRLDCYFHPDDAGDLARRFAEALAVDRVQYLEHRMRHKDGRYIWVGTTSRPYFDAEGLRDGLITSSRDVSLYKELEAALLVSQADLEKRVTARTEELTALNQRLHREIDERRRTESALRESEAKYKALFRGSPIALLEVRTEKLRSWLDDIRRTGVEDVADWFRNHPEEVEKQNGHFQIVNLNEEAEKLALRLVGPDRGKAADFFLLLCREAYGDVISGYGRGVARGKSMTTYTAIDGKTVHAVFRWQEIPETKNILISVDDITRQLEAENMFRESEKHLQSLMVSAEDFVVYRLVEDPDQPHGLRVVFASPSIREVLGVEDPLDFSSWFRNIHADDERRVSEANALARDIQRFHETMKIWHPIKMEWRYVTAVSNGFTTHSGKTFANGIIIDVTERMRVEEALQDYQLRLQRMTSRLSMVEERERRRIAMDLHDHIGQNLAMGRLKIMGLLESVRGEREKAELETLLDIVKSATADVRLLTQELSPPLLYDLGLEPALDWLAEQLTEKYGLPIFLEWRLGKDMENIDRRVALFRSAREVLMNAVRHSHADQVSIVAAGSEGSVQVTITDNGVGFDPQTVLNDMKRGRGFGLFSIRERLLSLGGRLNIVSKRSIGTRVELFLPRRAANKAVSDHD